MFQKIPFTARKAVLLHALLIILFCLTSARAQTGQTVYGDSLQNGWENWSWANVNLNNSSPVHGGTASVSVNAGAWQAFYLHHATFSTAGYTTLSFWIHGGSQGGQKLLVQATVAGAPQAAVELPALAANTWQEVTIPLSSLGVANGNMDGFWIQDRTGAAQPVFYLDDISLGGGPVEEPPPSGSVSINVDANLNRRPISPLIYGTAFASTEQLRELNSPLNRSGGNNTSRYNWQLNADNRGNDWFFESIPFANQPGEVGDTFIQNTKNAGAEPMLTIPMIDWIAKVGPNREKLASFSISKYGAQTANDWEWFPDAGNGILLNGQFVVNDPNDANVPNSVAFQQGWVNHLLKRWGTASGGGLRYYILDNEYSIWHATHRDAKPQGATMDEVFAEMRDYAAMIKSADPSALVVGPEEWGWDGYRYSGYDLWYAPRNNWTFPDREAHGNMDYVAWLLQQFRLDEQKRGVRLLDVFSLHYYPQSGEYSNDVSTAMQLRRNRSTRSLWDPNYTDESWINDKVQLIPRMKNWVAQYYPNTKIALTEYSWGAENHINGATAQADILGILGREGIDMATRWTTPATSTPTFKAMKMYRNYDGKNSTFGETSVSAQVPNPDNVSAFAALREADGALTVMVINKTTSGTNVNLNIANFNASGTAEVWQLTAANRIDRLADVTVSGSTISTPVPSQSITLFVIKAQSSTAPNSPSSLSGEVFSKSVTLTWQDNSADEDGFIIERANAASPKDFSVFVELAPNATRWRGTVKSGTYIFRVRAKRGQEISAASNVVELSVR